MAKANKLLELELENKCSKKAERELEAELSARPSQFDGNVDSVFMRGSFNTSKQQTAQQLLDGCNR